MNSQKDKKRGSQQIPDNVSFNRLSQRPVVLVVEDQPPARKYLLFLLKRLSLNPLVAETGEKALDILENQPVDCILMDISLGAGMSGLALMKMLRKKKPFQTTPMIAVTTYEKKNLLNGAVKGFTDYLQKPYLLQDLENILKKHSITPKPSER